MFRKISCCISLMLIITCWSAVCSAQQMPDQPMAIPLVVLSGDEPQVRQTWLFITDSKGKSTGNAIMVRSRLDGSQVDMVMIQRKDYSSVFVIYKGKLQVMLTPPSKKGDTGTLMPLVQPWVEDTFSLGQAFAKKVSLPEDLPKLDPRERATLYLTTYYPELQNEILGMRALFQLDLPEKWRIKNTAFQVVNN